MDNPRIFERYYDLSLRFLSYRPRSEKEVLDYLKKKKIDEPSIILIINKLKSHNFLNDLDFSKFWIEKRLKIKPKAYRIIVLELKQKGISQEIIEKASELFDSKNEMDIKSAIELIERRARIYQNLPKDKAKEKLMNYLARRGFSYDTIKKAMRDIDEKTV